MCGEENDDNDDYDHKRRPREREGNQYTVLLSPFCSQPCYDLSDIWTFAVVRVKRKKEVHLLYTEFVMDDYDLERIFWSAMP